MQKVSIVWVNITRTKLNFKHSKGPTKFFDKKENILSIDTSQTGGGAGQGWLVLGDVGNGSQGSYKMESKHLQVLGNPLYSSRPAPVRLCSDANDSAPKLDLVAPDAEGGGLRLDAAHPVPHPGHDTRVEKVKDSRRKGNCPTLEFDSGSLQSFLSSSSLDIFPRSCLRCVTRGLGEMIVHMPLKHGLKLDGDYR